MGLGGGGWCDKLFVCVNRGVRHHLRSFADPTRVRDPRKPFTNI